MPLLRGTGNSMPLTTYCIAIDDPRDPGEVILFCTRTAAAVTVERGVLHDIREHTLPPDEQVLLEKLGLLVESREQERQEMLGYVNRMNADSNSVHLAVVMNLDCNLACPYCFEGNRKGKHYLSHEASAELSAALGTWLRGKQEVQVAFYGGEPLLSAGMIEQICRRMQAWAAADDVRFSFSLVTNGTLLARQTVDRLKPLGLTSVRVTLDGPKEVHDRSRPFKGGVGSFDAVLKNLQSVKDAVTLNVGGNYTRGNYTEFPRLLDTLIESGLGPDRIASILFSPVFNEECRFMPDYHDGCCDMSEPWIAEASLFLRREIVSRGFHTPAVEPAVCMIERRDHLVVNWDSGLYKCTGLIGRTEYQVGTLSTGLICHSVSHNLGNWKNEICLSCCYLPLCFGGCRYFRLLRTGSMQGVECKKEFFDQALPELVLQDMARVAAEAR